MDSSTSSVSSGEIPHNMYSKSPLPKLKTIGFAIAIIIGIGGVAVVGVGVCGYLQVGILSNLGQINAIIMMASSGGGGITLLIVGIVGSVKNCQKDVTRDLDSLLIEPDEIVEGRRERSSGEQEALKFARQVLQKHPEVKHTDFDWGCFAKKGFSGIDGTPVNNEIAKLSYIFDTFYVPKFNEAIKHKDPWSRQEGIDAADACLKLSYAIVCLVCEDIPALKRKLPKKIREGFDLGWQGSYQYRWIVFHTKIYQHVRHASKSEEHSKRFYEEGTIQSQWRNLFNNHCDYVNTRQPCHLGDQRFYKWFSKDTPEQPLAELDSRFDLPT